MILRHLDIYRRCTIGVNWNQRSITVKRFEIFCGNMAWTGFGWTDGKGRAFWDREEAERACEALQEHYIDAQLSVEDTTGALL